MGIAVTHSIAAGMGGMRTAGDLVARMQMSRGMKIREAKRYVAEKLGISIRELSDPVVMNELRAELDIGTVTQMPELAKGIETKFRIAEILGIEINCVNRFKKKVGLSA
jgi:dimethylamine--corrinoid protein Co-methyltransferase